jgi:sarcosine oxidase
MKQKIIVIGAGAFGGWTALTLLRKGYDVTLVDAWGAGHSRSSSGDETRVIRSVYVDKIYVEMAQRSMQIWRENEPQFGHKIFHEIGVLNLIGQDDSRLNAALQHFNSMNIPYQELSLNETKKKVSLFQFRRHFTSCHGHRCGLFIGSHGLLCG